MNLLAHAVLSGTDDNIRLGNFVGDFIKGDPTSPRHGLPTLWIRGVWLHRHIDQYTDSHPISVELKSLLRPYCHKYAGVALDVLYDHLLAVSFRDVTGMSLNHFTEDFYTSLNLHFTRLPVDAQHMASHMIRHNWLAGYQNIEGVRRSLSGMARRTAFPSNLERAVECLTSNYTIFADAFSLFFPEIQNSCRVWLAEDAGGASFAN